MAFGKLTELCNHYRNLTLEHFQHLKKSLCLFNVLHLTMKNFKHTNK